MAGIVSLLALVFTLHLCYSANNEIDIDSAFDSSDPFRPNLMLDHITIYNLHRQLLSVTVRVDSEYSFPDLKGMWFVDGRPLKYTTTPYGMATSCNFVSGKQVCEVFLTSDPGTNLETLTTKILRLEIGRFLKIFDKPLAKNRDITWLQIEIAGSELSLYIDKKEQVLKFDELRYKINEYSGHNFSYTADFSFAEISKSTVDVVDVTYKSIQLYSYPTAYGVSSATCNREKCMEYTDFIKLFDNSNPFDKNFERRKSVFFLLTNDVVENYKGVVRIDVHTTNIMNTKITETFDITSYVYGNWVNAAVMSDIWITDLDFTSTDDLGIIRCRGMGDDIEVSLYSLQGKREQIPLSASLRSRHITTAFFVFLLTEDSQGKYVCKMKNGKSSSQEKTINLKCRPKDIAEIRGKPLCYET